MQSFSIDDLLNMKNTALTKTFFLKGKKIIPSKPFGYQTRLNIYINP